MKPERWIEGEVLVDAPKTHVWDAWTTTEGIRTFFGPDGLVDAVPGGHYEIYFLPGNPPGARGAEGTVILALQPQSLLSFTWNAPPTLPEARLQRTVVIIRLEEVTPQQTRVGLRHLGWGTGGQWDEAFEYFSRAWLQVVLPRLRYRFENGPVNWANPPTPEELNT